MAWTTTEWACGHHGYMQLYGKHSERDYQVSKAAGMKCMTCWLVKKWEEENDPRALRVDRYQIANKIAKNKGKRIFIPDEENIPVKISNNPLANFSNDELLTEIERRKP